MATSIPPNRPRDTSSDTPDVTETSPDLLHAARATGLTANDRSQKNSSGRDTRTGRRCTASSFDHLRRRGDS